MQVMMVSLWPCHVCLKAQHLSSFGRSVAGSGDSQDVNLNGSYYVLFGISDNSPTSGFIGSHTPGNPSISNEQVNVLEDAGVQGAGDFENIKRSLLQAHGILMMITWPILVNTAIFFASFMRPALPNGKWFQVHRGLMIGALFIGALAFMLAFISQLRSSTPGLVDLGTDRVTVRLEGCVCGGGGGGGGVHVCIKGVWSDIGR